MVRFSTSLQEFLSRRSLLSQGCHFYAGLCEKGLRTLAHVLCGIFRSREIPHAAVSCATGERPRAGFARPWEPGIAAGKSSRRDTFVSAVWLLGDGKRSPPCKACLRQMKTEWSIPRSGRFQRNAVHPQRGEKSGGFIVNGTCHKSERNTPLHPRGRPLSRQPPFTGITLSGDKAKKKRVTFK